MSLPIFEMQFDGSSVGPHDRLGDTQPQPATIGFAAVGRIAAVKAVKYARQLLWRDAYSGIGDAQFGKTIAAHEIDIHAAMTVVVLDCIFGEIEEQLTQTMLIAFDYERIATQQLHSNRGGPGQNLAVRHTFSNEVVKTHRLSLERKLTGVGLRKECQAIDDSG